MSPTVLEIVAAFEADQRQKNAVDAKEAADRQALFNAEMKLREETITGIVNEFQPALARAYPEAHSAPLGCRHYWDTSGKHLIIRCRTQNDGLMHYEAGSGFQDVHRKYLRDSFSTTDVTEFKVNVAQRIGVKLAGK